MVSVVHVDNRRRLFLFCKRKYWNHILLPYVQHHNVGIGSNAAQSCASGKNATHCRIQYMNSSSALKDSLSQRFRHFVWSLFCQSERMRALVVLANPSPNQSRNSAVNGDIGRDVQHFLRHSIEKISLRLEEQPGQAVPLKRAAMNAPRVFPRRPAISLEPSRRLAADRTPSPRAAIRQKPGEPSYSPERLLNHVDNHVAEFPHNLPATFRHRLAIHRFAADSITISVMSHQEAIWLSIRS